MEGKGEKSSSCNKVIILSEQGPTLMTSSKLFTSNWGWKEKQMFGP